MDIDPTAPFSSASAGAVRAIRQRDLLNTWLRLYAKSGAIPRFDEYCPERMADELMDTVYCTVQGGADEPRVMIDSDGVGIASAYGKRGQGQLLDDYLGARLAPVVLPVYRECVRQRLPIYTVSTVVDLHGHQVDYERLLMPFFNGERVDRIIASLKTISEDGGFEKRNLMRANDSLPIFTLRCVIDQNLVQPAARRVSTNDVIEFI
jgi:hypothetical protein